MSLGANAAARHLRLLEGKIAQPPAPGGLVFAAVLFAVLAIVVALGIYVGIPLALGILVFPALLGLTGWGVFLSTVGSFAGVWLVLGLLNRLNK